MSFDERREERIFSLRFQNISERQVLAASAFSDFSCYNIPRIFIHKIL